MYQTDEKFVRKVSKWTKMAEDDENDKKFQMIKSIGSAPSS